MENGNLIGKGTTAEVYEWGEDKVLKLYFKQYSENKIKYTARIGQIVHEAGIPSPASYEVINIDGRTGVILQRISGKSILRHLEVEPLNLAYYTIQTAQLHFKIHNYTSEKLPSQKDRLALAIMESSELLGDKLKTILSYLERLPDGGSVCHGDLHFDNIMVSNNGLIAIDWSTASRGNPLGDVARTCLTIKSPTVPPGTPPIIKIQYLYCKWLTYQTYLYEYMRIAKVRLENIDDWVLPVAAARLKDKIPGEEKWLLDTINKQLEKLKG